MLPTRSSLADWSFGGPSTLIGHLFEPSERVKGKNNDDSWRMRSLVWTNLNIAFENATLLSPRSSSAGCPQSLICEQFCRDGHHNYPGVRYLR